MLLEVSIVVTPDTGGGIVNRRRHKTGSADVLFINLSAGSTVGFIF